MEKTQNTFRPAMLVTLAMIGLLFAGFAIIRFTSEGIVATKQSSNAIPVPGSPKVKTTQFPIAGSALVAQRVTSLNPPLTSLTPATRLQMEGWLKNRFATEYKDITIHRVLELSKPESTPDGYSIATFRYVGSFSWKKGYFLSNRRYTFTANGDFVRSTMISPSVHADSMSELLPR